MKVHDKENNAPLQPLTKAFFIKLAIVAILFILLLGMCLVIVTSLLKCKNKPDEDVQDFNKTASIVSESNVNDIHFLRIVSRDGWLAEPPHEGLDKLMLPVHRVIIGHSATENCTSQATCTYRTRVLQDFHMKSRGFNDIAYNFLVGGDGYVYEGRGWDQQGAHTKGFNADSIGITFIGTFTTVTPPEKQLNAAKLLIEEGIRLNKILKDYRLYGSRQLVGSESPGSALYEIIKKWPNWSNSL